MASPKETWEEPGASDRVLSLATVQKMLPLVRGIVADLLVRRGRLDDFVPEQDRLERGKRSLGWSDRRRRYALQEQITCEERAIQSAVDELRDLGLSLLDAGAGRVGFPTLVNNRRAYFTWQPSDDGLHSWQFAEENVCRPIPQAWLKEISVTGKQAP